MNGHCGTVPDKKMHFILLACRLNPGGSLQGVCKEFPHRPWTVGWILKGSLQGMYVGVVGSLEGVP